MPRPRHHALALFSLIPYDDNERAKAVVKHPCNSHLVSTVNDGELALDVGFNIRSKSCNTLATLGRGDTDIFVDGANIAKIQCTFEIDLDTNIVMLYDRSYYRTTQVYGKNAMPFEHERPRRRVVVQEGLNDIIGMGGEGRNLVLFKLQWHNDAVQTMEKIKNRENAHLGYEENPRLARTVDEAITVASSRRQTRPHTPGPRQLKMRYATIGGVLGSGQFGEVCKAINVDSGTLMAVKILKPPARATPKQQEWSVTAYYALKREVENLAKVDHPNVVDYIASQGWDETQIEIFMGLKEGSLESLIGSRNCPPVAESVFHQMLQALDCLAVNDIVHRDVKPANILYVTLPGGQYQFQLGDFGLSNRGVSAHTFVGSILYMAPEFFQKGVQSHKVDVWSLFVTMLWVLDIKMFRRKQFQSYHEVREMVLSSASDEPTLSQIREMAIVNTEERASTAQMLVKCFNGEGLSTPRNQVPAFNTHRAIAAAAPARAPVPAPPTLTTRTVSKAPRDLQKHANIFTAAAQHGVQKRRYQPQLPRRAITPVAEKHLEQALIREFAEKPRIPGASPGER